jgi:hypothetical protein
MSEVKHIQSELEPHEYVEFKRAAKKKGITLKEAAREAIVEWTREEAGFNMEDPFFRTASMFKGPKDMAETHDDIYED